ncbi:hypothetical protein [Sulfurimonas sp.]|uniref:hypothetical protein n=1 Tax=Sulfurimonas sp. TaxID=2022749 RepID=UPI0025D757EB|nr:hypothetical protein [Sulfurimonas sp.]MCK9472696.1 hypothetical protein [Sulfurimonas sp.]MDD3505657.1 hypothetical protein [Sulfurimonas sp.]
MKEIFKKHKIIIFRTTGVVMLLVGFIVYFWMTPKEVYSENEIAAANVARMQASVRGTSASSKQSSKPETSKFIEELKNAQKAQVRYLTILSMVFGVLFLGYSFIPKPKSDSLKKSTSDSEI